jgi:hypothetical protein
LREDIMARVTYTVEFKDAADGTKREPTIWERSKRVPMESIINITDEVEKVTEDAVLKSGSETTVLFITDERKAREDAAREYRYAMSRYGSAWQTMRELGEGVAIDLHSLADRLDRKNRASFFVNPEEILNPETTQERDQYFSEYHCHAGKASGEVLHELNWGIANLRIDSYVQAAVALDLAESRFLSARQTALAVGIDVDDKMAWPESFGKLFDFGNAVLSNRKERSR